MIENEKFKLILFTIYTIMYESLIWGLTASSIYYVNMDKWIILVAIVMSSAQLRPIHFGLPYMSIFSRRNRL
jgi:hypothetical protein